MSFRKGILEYASKVLDLRTQHAMDTIEALQQGAARYVLKHYHNTSSVKSMLEELQWPSLRECRHTARLTMLYKIHDNHVSATGLKSKLMLPSPCQ